LRANAKVIDEVAEANAKVIDEVAEANAKVIDEVAEANAKVIDEVAEANAKESKKTIYLCEINCKPMDIDLLSKMVKELILDNDRVVLPGFGAFVAEIVPSTFSDKGYTINPPYRKLYFRTGTQEDSALVEFYARSNDVDLAVAYKVVSDFVAELKTVLFSRKTVIFPGLGRLRATKENAVFFVADEDMDIYPDGFGLEPISLKTHVETPQEISEAVAQLKAIVEEPVVEETVAEQVEEPVVEEMPVEEPVEEPVAEEQPMEIPVAEEIAEPVEEEIAEPVAEPVAEEVEAVPETVTGQKKPSAGRTVLIILISIIILALLLLGAFMAVAHWAPEYLDTLLYTPEELEILNYKL